MVERKGLPKSKLLILPPLALGIAILAWAAITKAPPPKAQRGEPTRKVRVIEVPSMALVPRVIAHGTVQPERAWNAVADVAGRIVATHPQLHDGAVIPADEELLRIDPSAYELALAQMEAELAQLQIQETSSRASIEIERRNLRLAEKDLARVRKLLSKGTVPQSQVDSAERAMLNAQQAVQNLENALAIIPTERRLLEAKVAQSRLDLEHCLIQAPFDMRVADLGVQETQYVSKGQSLLKGESIDRVEIESQVSLTDMRALVMNRADVDLVTGVLTANLPEILDLQALVRLDLGTTTAEWEASFSRMNTIDPKTRTMGVVVAVDEPYKKIIKGSRPPLVTGMFVEIVLQGPAQPDRVVVPRSSVRNGAVYLADEESRLRKQVVEVLFSQGGLSVIGEGLEGGETLVVSDLVPAVAGMRLELIEDETLTAEVARMAGAGESTP